ncbi:MAG: hypothetical protein J5647_07020 [Spirochaetaceae bacterium]|nr:hypothetical protein [Spirochaetaceae bacterium]
MSSIVFAIIGFVFVGIGLFPLFGWLNWIGLVFCFIGLMQGFKARHNIVNKLIAIVGIIINLVLVIVAIIRLVIGVGVV